MKTTILTSVALAACVGTSVFATTTTKLKKDVITLSLTAQVQSSVSNDKSKANYGKWSTGPMYYKTASEKFSQKELLQAISYVMHDGNANYYGKKAQLVLVQGELSGFIKMSPRLANAEAENFEGYLTGEFFAPGADPSTALPNSTDSLFVGFPNGRHLAASESETFPVGHIQPWGQIYVQDPDNDICENVTFFFNITVQECYDCFYMNSFISTANFNLKTSSGKAADGPPCCSGTPSESDLLGNGKDQYYMTFSFDNTVSNPYLVRSSGVYVGYPGIANDVIPGDGLIPDAILEDDNIQSGIGSPQPYLARFTLNGIVTYNWNLKFVNSTDAYADFVGKATYPANGYGFIALYCALLNGTVNFSESIVNIDDCCTGEDWTDSWYGIGVNNVDDVDQDTPFNEQVSTSHHINSYSIQRNPDGTPLVPAISWPVWFE
jgi:hypothetical protein